MPTIPVERDQAQRKAQIAHAFDLVADEEYQQAHGGFHERVGDRLVRLAALRAGDRVLDVGCGRGAVLFPAAQAVGPDGYVAGIDLSVRMAHATADAVRARGLRNVSVRVDDAESPGFPAESFESVLSSFVLHLTPDPGAAVAAARRVLVPSGRFGATGFGEDTDPSWRAAFAALLSFVEPAAEPSSGGPKADLATLLDSAGFTDIRVTDEVVTSDYPTPEHWWRSQWGGGRRALLERIPAPRRAEAKRAAFAALPPAPLQRATHVLFTTATAP